MRPPLILSFVGEQKQGVLTWSSQQICREFETHGYKTAVLNLKEPETSLPQLKELIANHNVYFAFGFAGVGGPIRLEGKSLWDVLRVPFFGLMADHPAYNPALHSIPSPYATRLYMTKDFFDTQRLYLPQPRPSYLFPPQFQENPLPDSDRWQDRPIDYLFLKNGSNPALIEQEWAHCDRQMQDIIWDSIRFCETRTDVLIADVVARRAGLARDSINDTSTDFWMMVQLIDTYLRSRRQNWMVGFLKNFPALIVGDGWEHIDRTNCKATFRQAVEAGEIYPLYRQTKIVFNTNPYYDHNVHERVVLGLSSKNHVVTDENAFVRGNLRGIDGMVGFAWDDADKEQRIADALTGRLEREPANDRTDILARFDNGPEFLFKLIKIADRIRADNK